MIDYDKRRIRKGKTQRMRDNGETAKNRANKHERAEWQKAWRANGNKAGPDFPAYTCNGKRNRFLK